MDTGERRLWASGTFDATEALEMIQVELGTSSTDAAVRDVAPDAPRPHVDPDWREE